MPFGTYSVVQQYDFDDVDEKELQPVSVQRAHQPWKTTVISLTMTLLLTSLSFNIYGIIQHSQASESLNDAPSKYGTWLPSRSLLYEILTFMSAGLYRDLPTEIVEHTDYDSPNRTIENAAWDNPDLLPEHGFVALDDSWAASKDLPTTQRWPWDKNKGVYILTSSHELHCVVRSSPVSRISN